MNELQHELPGRLAELSPFDVRITAETAKPEPHVRHADSRLAKCQVKSEADAGEAYGCVDWYLYPNGGAERARPAA